MRENGETNTANKVCIRSSSIKKMEAVSAIIDISPTIYGYVLQDLNRGAVYTFFIQFIIPCITKFTTESY